MNQRKLNIGRIFVRFRPNRKHRDRLFRRIFEDKKDLLIYISMKNDTSFIISSTLNLYEHQSTFSPNMPIRGFLYFARLYETHVKKLELNLYGKNLVKLPLPRFVVFYNGREEQLWFKIRFLIPVSLIYLINPNSIFSASSSL